MGVVKTGYTVVSVVGLVLSCYAVYIEHAKMADENYQAMCDLSESVSCTSILTSEYSVGLGVVSKLLGEDSILNIPSAYYGTVLYAILILLSFCDSKPFLYLKLFLNTLSMLGSVFLTYILMFVMEKTCLVCYGIHVVNTLLLVAILIRLCCDHPTRDINKEKKRN